MQRSNRPQRQTRTSSHQLSKLPDYLVLDLRESFKFFDPENSGYVSVHHLKAILQNFGMSKMPRKEMDEEISSVIGTSKVVDWNDLVTIMAQLQRGSYKDQELKETFRVMDKRDRGTISVQEFKNALQSHVAVPISESEINELLEAAGVDGSSGITFKDFTTMINL